VVRQRRALGVARRAGGVLDVDRVIELKRRLDIREVAFGYRFASALERVPVVVEVERRYPVGALAAGGVEHRAVAVGAEALGVAAHVHAVWWQASAPLACGGGGVDVDENRADAGRGVLGDDPLLAVGGPDADALPLADAEREQAARHPRGRVPELAVREPRLP